MQTYHNVKNIGQVRIGGKQTYRVNSEYARWFDECTSKPGTYPATLVIPTTFYDTELPYLVVEWDGVITACNWQPCFGGVAFAPGDDTRGKAMKGFTRIELLVALKDKRCNLTDLIGWLEAVEQRCVECLARLIESMTNAMAESNHHMVGYYAKLIKTATDTIEEVQRYRRCHPTSKAA
jgi:hypothetical protein